MSYTNEIIYNIISYFPISLITLFSFPANITCWEADKFTHFTRAITFESPVNNKYQFIQKYIYSYWNQSWSYSVIKKEMELFPNKNYWTNAKPFQYLIVNQQVIVIYDEKINNNNFINHLYDKIYIFQMIKPCLLVGHAAHSGKFPFELGEIICLATNIKYISPSEKLNPKEIKSIIKKTHLDDKSKIWSESILRLTHRFLSQPNNNLFIFVDQYDCDTDSDDDKPGRYQGPLFMDMMSKIATSYCELLNISLFNILPS